jgi:hypothetical protein
MSDYSVPITLGDGKPRQLRYDWNALEALEETAGISLDSLQRVMSDPKQRMRNLRLILWAGLIHEDETLTPKTVGQLMTPLTDAAEWGEKITIAFKAAFGEGDGEPKNA